MKISLEWLREYVDYTGSVERLVEIFTHVGLPVEEVCQVGADWMLNVEVTSNRPDCLGHIGLAREVAAVTGAALRLPEVALAESGKPVDQWASVEDAEPALCGRYTARIIDGIKVAPSPEWLRRRLETIGLRPISNVVDVTNYVMMEIGQPLHSFDYHKLGGGKIIVRRARQGEQMVSIDHSKLALSDRMLVIADEREPVAIAGIMGGLASEVADTTRTVLLESAHFEPLSVRTTSRGLTLGSDSAYRFERNVDDIMTEWASRRAAALLAELTGGKVAPGVIDLWPARHDLQQVSLRLARLKQVLGFDIAVDRVVEILGRLGFAPRQTDAGTITCTIPSWRSRDVSREADLIEDVIRIHGYEHVPIKPKIQITVKTADAIQKTRASVTAVLTGSGFYETVSVGFVEDKYGRLFAEEGFEPLRVTHTSRKQANALRASVLPSLMESQKRNQDAGNKQCELFELAAVHRSAGPEKLPQETLMLGLAGACDFRTLRGTLEEMIRRLDRNAALLCQPTEVLWAAGQTGAVLSLEGQCLGYAGLAGEPVMKAYDMDHPIVLAEIRFEALLNLQGRAFKLTPMPRFPGIVRDVSLVLDEAVCWSDIEKVIVAMAIGELHRLEFVDIYRGKGIDAGQKSLTLSVEFRRAEGTLTHEEVDQYMQAILKEAQSKLHAQLRA